MSDIKYTLIDEQVCQWLAEAREIILSEINNRLTVETKNGRKDLVTNVDKQVEQFLTQKIKTNYPQSHILGEEGFGDIVGEQTDGIIWIVDPIDGTMNFVKQKNNFAVMIGIYKDQQPILGYILNVISGELIHGGPTIGLYSNENQLSAISDQGLADGLIGLSGPLLVHNDYHMREIGDTALGMRIYGSAGLEIMSVIKGELIGYISYLKPWDFGAGKILAECCGLSFTMVDGQPLNMLSSGVVLIATKRAHGDILTIVSQ